MLQKSKEWFEARAGKITASRLGDVIARETSKRHQLYMMELVSELSGAPYLEDDAPWFKHGKLLEPFARDRYEMEMFLKGQEEEVKEVGFIIHPKHNFIGASPDGEITSIKGLEIKSSEVHSAYLKNVKKGLPSTHKPQVQGQMMICGYESVDFVCFFRDPDGKLPDEIHIENILPDLEYHKMLEEKCLDFWSKIQEQIDAYSWEP